jgi:hypothetical protein
MDLEVYRGSRDRSMGRAEKPMEMIEEREERPKPGSGEVTARVVLVPACPQAAGDDADAAWNAHAWGTHYLLASNRVHQRRRVLYAWQYDTHTYRA